jgi:hypothetical protein
MLQLGVRVHGAIVAGQSTTSKAAQSRGEPADGEGMMDDGWWIMEVLIAPLLIANNRGLELDALKLGAWSFFGVWFLVLVFTVSCFPFVLGSRRAD